MLYCPQNFGQAGDLLSHEEVLLLHLGDTVAFPEMYPSVYPPSPFKVKISGFFDQHFLAFLHWMVYARYSSYKQVMKHFLNLEIKELLKRAQKVASLPAKKNPQTLVIFPDHWTRFNIVGPERLTDANLLSLSSGDSQARKDLHWRTIKKGLCSTVLATHSEVFQPFSHLEKIFLYDPHKRYYHHQQDPRYHLPLVAEKMAEIYQAELILR